MNIYVNGLLPGQPPRWNNGEAILADIKALEEPFGVTKI